MFKNRGITKRTAFGRGLRARDDPTHRRIRARI